ncbi:MAG: hypothetical protein IKG18_06500 [Atopobiaceae bacterium]|nr:hypothetical protein [Atopobiaceae bacterium]
MKKAIAFVAALATSLSLAACGGTPTLSVTTDETGIHAVADKGAEGTGSGEITIDEGYGLCVNHIVEQGSFHVKATDEKGSVVLDKDLTDNIADLVPANGQIAVTISAQDAVGTVDVIAYDEEAQAQAEGTLDDALAEVNMTREDVGLANPWSSAKTTEEAAEGAGVGYFQVPADSTEVDGTPLNWNGYQYMEHLAEADGTLGTAELTVRKGLNQESEDVSGDYNEYAEAWDLEADGWTVHCFGNEKGKASKAIWISDNFSYSITTRDKADPEVSYTLSDDAITALVSEIQ